MVGLVNEIPQLVVVLRLVVVLQLVVVPRRAVVLLLAVLLLLAVPLLLVVRVAGQYQLRAQSKAGHTLQQPRVAPLPGPGLRSPPLLSLR